MESPAFFYIIFLWCLLLSITGYSIYVGFGPPSKKLRDPFEEHEDQKKTRLICLKGFSPLNSKKIIFPNRKKLNLQKKIILNYLTIRGGSLKKIAKKIIPKVPTNKKV